MKAILIEFFIGRCSGGSGSAGTRPRSNPGRLLSDASHGPWNTRSTIASAIRSSCGRAYRTSRSWSAATEAELPRVSGPISSYSPRPGSRESGSGIIIEVPRGGPTDRAAADLMREIRSILTAVGVPSNAIYVRHLPSKPITSLASIKLNYSRLVAEAGPCGQWPYDLGPSVKVTRFLENQPYWNLGCATQRNLAAMVDNPSDLVQPRGEVPAYAPRRSVVLEKWRKGENPSGVYSGYEAGKISDLGK